MRLSGRRSQTIYKVYGEDEYLAGADPSVDWDAPVRGEPTHGRRGVRRLAGAAALTGAVGTVGGLIGFATVSGRSAGHRELAKRRAPFTTTRPTASHLSVSSARVTRRGMRVPPAKRRRIDARTMGRLPVEPARARHDTTVRAFTAGSSRRVPAAVASDAMPNAAVASAAPSTSTEAEVRPRAQSEFGFER
jgi:hypothetical protein